MAGLELLYLVMFLLGFSGSAALVWWTRRRMASTDDVDLYVPEPTDTTGVAGSTPRMSSRPTPLSLPSVSAEDVGDQPAIAQLIFATGDEGDRECPTCKRRFDDATMLCPFDSTPLQSARANQRRAKPAITGARRPTCLTCGRRYESAARFCYHDGRKLSADSPTEVPIMTACRNCGFETTKAHETCSCGAPDIVEIDPSTSEIRMPTIPMMQCRSCNHLSLGPQTHCPNDGDLLYPVMNVSMNALPPTGIGPRRKLCQKCGRKFATAARYCAYDGSKLQHLN